MSTEDLTHLSEPPGPATEADYGTGDVAIGSENPLALLVTLGERYGEIVRCPNHYGQSYLYNHPRFVQHFLHSSNYERTKLLKIALGEGTLSSDGPIWKRQRRIVNPAFQPARVRSRSTSSPAARRSVSHASIVA